jgi:hypothetical protein
LIGLAGRLSGGASRYLPSLFCGRPRVTSLADSLVRYGEMHLEEGMEADRQLARSLVSEAVGIYLEMGRSESAAGALAVRARLDAALAECAARSGGRE